MLKKGIIDVLYIKGITISIPSLHQQISQLRILLRKLICLYIDLYNDTIRFDLIIGFGFNRLEEYGKLIPNFQVVSFIALKTDFAAVLEFTFLLCFT